MADTIVVLKTAKIGADRLPSFAYESNLLIKSKIGWKAVKAFSQDDFYKLGAFMAKNKKDVDYCVSFDGKTIKYFARCANDKIEKDKVDLSNIKPHTERFKVLDGLRSYNLASSALIDAIKERDPLD